MTLIILLPPDAFSEIPGLPSSIHIIQFLPQTCTKVFQLVFINEKAWLLLLLSPPSHSLGILIICLNCTKLLVFENRLLKNKKVCVTKKQQQKKSSHFCFQNIYHYVKFNYKLSVLLFYVNKYGTLGWGVKGQFLVINASLF